MKLPPIETHEGRRAFAFFAILGGCIVQTLYVSVVTYLLRDHAEYLFWLAMAGNVLLVIGMTALGWAMGRRMLAEVSKDGVKINDGGGE